MVIDGCSCVWYFQRRALPHEIILHINDDESSPFRIEFKHLQFSFCKIRGETSPDFTAAFEPAGEISA
jgi:hypothetical protein